MPASRSARRRTALAAAAALLAAGAAPADTGPSYADGVLTFPEGATVPRSLTDTERAAMLADPALVPTADAALLRGPGAPAGDIVCPPEYAPCQAIMIAWEGPAAWTSILAQMGGQITTLGDADLIVVVDSVSERSTVSSTLGAAGADMARVTFYVRPTDTIWMRDYGPRFIYQDGVRAIVDHTYNRPRPNDNAWPFYFASVNGFARYALPLVHGGGNFHLFGPGAPRTAAAFSTELIENENTSLTAQQIVDIWNDYQGLDTEITPALPSSVDSTQHIDMWLIPVTDDTVIVSDWLDQPGTAQDIVCDDFAAHAASLGFNVFRVPARTTSGTHYTYTNAVICNDIVLVPSYTNAFISPYNDDAVDTWQQALPDKTIVPINCEGIVSAAGVMHCIVKHVPEPASGDIPAVRIASPTAPASTGPGQNFTIDWQSDDDNAVTSIDVLLSTDGGATFPQALVTNAADAGSYTWAVDVAGIADARLRIVVRDAQGNTASADSFSIDVAYCDADFDRSTAVDINDYFEFLGAFFNQLNGPGSADIDGSGTVSITDYFEFLGLFFADFAAGCPS